MQTNRYEKKMQTNTYLFYFVVDSIFRSVKVALVATKDNIYKGRCSNPGFLISPHFKNCVILSLGY